MTAKQLTHFVPALIAFGCLLAGCGPVEPPEVDSTPPRAEQPRETPPPASRRREPSPPAKTEEAPVTVQPPGASPYLPDSRSLADLLNPADSAYEWIPDLSPIDIDEAQAAAAGIRKLTGRRLTLFTDLPDDPEIAVLTEAFDQAFGQWCDYFELDPVRHDDFRMTGFLMKDAERFRSTGLLPETLPPFEHGYSRNDLLWLYEQPSAYYRRHLLLHEGTHGFMNKVLGSCGPPWYAEGIAELLSTHRWQDGRLTLNWTPASREEVPMWGRIKAVKDAIGENRAPSLEEVLEYKVDAHRRTEPYAWCWAAATLLDRHPKYRDEFRSLARLVKNPDLSDLFVQLIGADWDNLSEQWVVFAINLEYGHDVAKTVLDFTPGSPIPASGATVTVAADRGWQNTGLQLAAGTTYRLTAGGRYQVADQPRVWWCEPGGISIRYFRGMPLGILMAAIRPDETPETGPRDLVRPLVIGLAATIRPKKTGTLHLQINDSPGELHDNEGSLTVEIQPN